MEHKFRVWDNDQMKFYYFDLLNVPIIVSFGAPVQQYCGLRDKSGKEIYEFDRWGDVMGLSTKATVIMHEGCWSLKWDTGAIGNLDAHVKTKAGNVVGNIFEPEGLVVSEGLIDNGV